MSSSSFDKLLSYICHDLLVDVSMAALRGGEITPEMSLYTTIQYLAGGLYSDVQFFTGMSTTSFYRTIKKTTKAITCCNQFSIKFPSTVDEVHDAAKGFESISSQGCIW